MALPAPLLSGCPYNAGRKEQTGLLYFLVFRHVGQRSSGRRTHVGVHPCSGCRPASHQPVE
eukprot:1835999-Prorocentrum_lima.AAC.1